MVLALTMTLGAIALASSFGSSFLPKFNEGTYTVFLMMPPGTSLEESERISIGVQQRLIEIEGVEHAVAKSGRAERDEHAEPPSNSEVEIRVAPDADASKVLEEIDAAVQTARERYNAEHGYIEDAHDEAADRPELPNLVANSPPPDAGADTVLVRDDRPLAVRRPRRHQQLAIRSLDDGTSVRIAFAALHNRSAYNGLCSLLAVCDDAAPLRPLSTFAVS